MKRFIVYFLALVCLCTAAAQAAGNTPPKIADVLDQVIAQDSGTPVLYFTVGDTETAFNSLAVSATSGNTALVPQTAANLALGGSLSQRTIQVKPVTGKTGVAVITLSVSDGSLTSSSAFTVTVTAPNTPPTLTGLPGYQRVSPVETPAAVAFSVGDAETNAGSLNVSAVSSNSALVPNANIILGGSGVSRTVRVTPISGQRGAAVIRLKVMDALGAFAEGEFIFSVFDSESANNAIPQARGLYVLDSASGTVINGVSMRDSSIRNLPFVDGYVLRTDWATLEPGDGVYSFTIIDNIFSKLPANQKLSLIVIGSPASWLYSLPGVTTWTAGNPSVTAPRPWDAVMQDRFRRLAEALGSHPVDGAALRDHPRLAAVNFTPPGLKNGIREPDEIDISAIPGYGRSIFQNAMLTHLSIVADNFPHVPARIGFWTYLDNQDASFGNVPPWEQLREAILASFNGAAHPRLGFWMENLAASRTAAEADPLFGRPVTSFGAALFLSQDSADVGFQALGSWARPFSAGHVDNLLNGTPEDGMDYAFNTFQCRYFELYGADLDFAAYTAEFQRWHDFLAALPHAATTFSGWLANRFTFAEQANPAVSGPTADPDGDGSANLLEYALNLDPHFPNGAGRSAPSLVRNASDGKDYLTMAYARRKVRNDMTYHVETSNDLINWNEGPAYTQETSVIDDGNDLTETVSARAVTPVGTGGSSGFLRLRITQP